jgi:uncharacterized membrane protein YqhA
MSDKPLLNVDVIEERIRRNLGRVMFTARWVMAPLYLGLLVALMLIVVKFVQQLAQAVPGYLALVAAWPLAILISIGLVGVLLAVSDRLSDGSGRK